MTDVKIYEDCFKQDVAALILDIQTNEFEIPITLSGQPDLNDITNFYQINNGNFWIATVDNSVVGTIALLDIGNGKGALRKMFVKAAFRGKNYGIGQKLLDTLLEWARDKHFSEILLGTTEKFIAAQRFYEKNGFAEIKKEALPPEFPIMSVDVKFYSQIL